MGPVERRRRRIRQRADGEAPVERPAADSEGAGRPGAPPPGRSAGERSAGDVPSDPPAAPGRAPAPGGPVRSGPDTGGRRERASQVASTPRAGRGRRSRADQDPDRSGDEGLRAPNPHDLAGLGGTFALTTSVLDPEPAPPVPETRVAEEAPNERGLRGLVGSGASQVRVTAAMRARDAARPTEEDLAAAERDLVIVRRGWVPREELPRPPRR